MAIACGSCGTTLKDGARFCGGCGAAAPAPREDEAAVARYREVALRFFADGVLAAEEASQLEALRARLGLSVATHERIVAELGPSAPAAPSTLRLRFDAATLRLFEVGTRCMLRIEARNEGDLALDRVEIHAEVFGEQALPVARSATLFPGKEEVVPVWLVPRVAGFQELRGVVHAVDLAGEHRFHRFEGLQFRVGTGGTSINVVNIDQSSARVVDNSRSSFGTSAAGGNGLVGSADWQPLPLRALSAVEAGAFVPALAVYAPPREQASASSATAPRQVARPANVQFVVKTEAAEYHVTSTLARGELATVYAGTRVADGASVAVKIADDIADNDLVANEARVLRLLRAVESPQSKHLPTLHDSFETGDGRLGNVLDRLDGITLAEVRRRLPDGVPPRHMIWLLRRCLSVLGWAHSRGILHANVDPAHILIRPQDHNVWLIDWCYAVVNPANTGERFKVLNEEYSAPEVAEKKPPLPSADLYSLGKCMILAAGGDPSTDKLPDGMDERMQRFLKFFVLKSALSRASDAWALYRQVDQLREELFGPHKFEEFIV